MDTSQSSSQGGQDFIDMVLSPSCAQSKEFEFQMCKNSFEKDASALSHADELFYKGKLLPLHLPPRLQMVQTLLQESGISLVNTNSLLESCSVSPTESCRASCELNPDEHFFPWSTGVAVDADSHLSKKLPWSKKIKLIRQSVLSKKLRSSRDYMKSFFIRPACTATEASCDKNVVSSEIDDHISFTCHRLSFSGAIKRNSTSNNNNKHSSSSTTTASSTASSNCSCSSSSFSLKSTNGFYEIDFLKKGVPANSEGEYSIESAIAHCKKSQQRQEKTSK